MVLDEVVDLAVVVDDVAAVAAVAVVEEVPATAAVVSVVVPEFAELAAMQPVMSSMPATLAAPAVRRARRAGWGRRRRLRAGVPAVALAEVPVVLGGAVGVHLDSFVRRVRRGFDEVDDRLGSSEPPQDGLRSPADWRNFVAGLLSGTELRGGVAQTGGDTIRSWRSAR